MRLFLERLSMICSSPQVFCGFVLLLVFRVLGSTAEDFFSPILTQISQDMGLPPRFAGGRSLLILCLPSI